MPYPISTSRQYANDRGWQPSRLGTGRTDDDIAKDCQKYLLILAQNRLPWEPMIDNIIMYVNHGRRFVQFTELWPGQQTGQEVFDDSAMIARNILVNGMVGALCSRNQPWFGLELPGKFNFPRSSGMRSWNGKRIDQYPQVQQWLQDCQTVMYSAFNRSNFYDVTPEFISDGVTNGTAHCITEEDIPQAKIVFIVPHYRECFIAQNEFGKVDTNYRVYLMTLRQFAQKFGYDKMESVDDNFDRDYKSNMHSEREVLHAVYPRSDYDPSRIDAANKKWASTWVYRKGGKILDSKSNPSQRTLGSSDIRSLSESGYDSMPVQTWRWRVNCDETYGRGPAHDAFVSIAQANQMGRTNLITAHQAAEPPLGAWADMRGAIQRGPGGITYIERNRGNDLRMHMPAPLYTGVQQLPFNIEFQDRVTRIINQHFHTDVFMAVTQIMQQHGAGRPVTEQINELQGEKAAILSTIVGNLHSEFFTPMIDRVFDIESRAGRIPSPPDMLLQSVHDPVQVEYLGPLAQAQTRLTTVRSITTGFSILKSMAEFNPTVIDAVDIDASAKEAMDAVGFPAGLYRNPKEIQAIREHREKMEQQERTAEQAPKLARAASSLAKAPEAGSIMQQLVGGEPGSVQ